MYSYLDLQNGLTELRIRIPHLASEVRKVQEENTHLLFEIEAFESPENLLKVAKLPEFAHLRFPIRSDILTLKQGTPLQDVVERTIPDLRLKPTITLATGAKNLQ
ncbi:MAG: hypothetical protein JSS30_05785 [Verrucomicrobia bacterium]|nr:hypothetical protein [Verrucomicrobiota bacterium]